MQVLCSAVCAEDQQNAAKASAAAALAGVGLVRRR